MFNFKATETQSGAGVSSNYIICITRYLETQAANGIFENE